ncbi:WXG100 family type VII secretion target [Nocardioides sp. MAHUQ-72]|uniref:WXG100 family type VII secretion target n=1 Tax=unclassified Nocardioides TaxID=2615069 RepID=UPI003623D2BE
MTINVEDTAFRTALADIDRAADRLHRARHHITREVDRLLDGGWTGRAAAAFAEGWEAWDHGSQDVLAGLQTLGRLVDAVHRDLVRQDVETQARLDRVAHAVVTAGDGR